MVLDNDYEVLGRLGEGSFGKVYKAQHKRTGDEVAVKQIKIGSRSWDEAVGSLELQALKSLRHPFIVRLRELIRSQWDGSLYYIFEFIDSDLCRLVKANPNGLEEPRAAELARQLYAGLSHMHLHNFFHRDLKPENILLDSQRETIRIADLGQARSLRARPPFTDYVGTRWYRAPECLLRDKGYSSPVDIWASGLICAELLRGSPLFCGTSTVDQLYKIFTVLGQSMGDWPDFARLAQAIRFKAPDRAGCGMARILPRASPQATHFLTEVLTIHPRRRPVAKKVLEHAFFSMLPPLDIERLDTHRSSATSRPQDDPEQDANAGASDADRTASKGQPEAPPYYPPPEPALPGIDDLDAELDKILGSRSDGEDPVAASSALNSSPEHGLDGTWSPLSGTGLGGPGGSGGYASSQPGLQLDCSRRARSLQLAPSECGWSALGLQEHPRATSARRARHSGEGLQDLWPVEGAQAAETSSASSCAPLPTVSASTSASSTPAASDRGASLSSASGSVPSAPSAQRLRRPWAAEEAGQLRQVVRRAIRRGVARGGRNCEALWLEVSAQVGGRRGPRECQLQYNRDCNRSPEASRRIADLTDDNYKIPCFFFAGSCSAGTALHSSGDAWRQSELAPHSPTPEPLCFGVATAGVVA